MTLRQSTETVLQIIADRQKNGNASPLFGDFLVSIAPNIQKIILSKGVSLQDAEDLTHNVLVALIRNIEQFDPDKGTFSQWVGGYIDVQVRKLHTRRRLVTFENAESDNWHIAETKPDTSKDARENIDAQDEVEYLKRKFLASGQHNPENKWRAFTASILQEQSPKQIAETTGIAHKTIPQLQNSVRKYFLANPEKGEHSR